MAINDYAVLADVQGALPDDQIDGTFNATYNTLLTALITRASRQFDDWTLRKPGAYLVNADVTNFFDGFDTFDIQAGSLTYKALMIEELAAAPTSVQVSFSGRTADFITYQTTDYFMWPYNALDLGEPYWAIVADFVNGSQYYFGWYPRNVQIAGKFGFSTAVPDMVKQAVIIQVARWFMRAKQRYQDLAVVTDPNQTIYKQFDDDFADTVAYYRKSSI